VSRYRPESLAIFWAALIGSGPRVTVTHLYCGAFARVLLDMGSARSLVSCGRPQRHATDEVDISGQNKISLFEFID